MSELIAAISTPPVPSAIGVLRLSGSGAAACADRVFRARSGRPLTQTPDRQLVYGSLLDRAGNVIDQVLATVSRAPHSYTGEDTAELQCHGAPVVLSMALEALYAAGARPARPGEFTQRAFLNGKLDLTQAEAVADLLEAETPQAARTAAGQLTGALSRRVEGIYDGLVDLLAHFHAVLDYPDEDIDPFRVQEIGEAMGRAERGLKELLATYDRGKFLTRGVPCAIVGLPNAGKSSLLNALLGYQRAIVTDIPGTTRDTVEERCVVGGVLLRLIDTAGLRDTDDPVEKLGVERSRAALAGAELALVLVDGSEAGEDPNRLAAERSLWEEAVARCPRAVLVFTKSDLPHGWERGFPFHGEGTPEVWLSARTGAGLEALGEVVARLFPQGDGGEAGSMLTNARQAQAAQAALAALQEAGVGLRAGVTPDAVLTDVESALESLGELTGRTVREDVVARIFSRFCVGK
ncbi:tRNA uridine-5-carboxymethylaminomethyl(34) synthesis GTPase MnmE [Intestinimonas butyriciproducens]|uniref:tRNA uridine-5-carboxymethylaminomethyl(34) synthesis GTPase MnmE n=1 Tax=Intestinimonas butyriciproducens TaxID=1297617 RepID=UPI0019571253|nr:tRNA uridine-5-carboxymethylaminomethyl(34) synthesis GTPase MnmE [Intestinimonas butyriciproducens]MBM6976127.1 tRNA uridine-5-carboxymethylaminomethyl(34) synthesis GTPase MnmE [Intestinimonas butyriciproducens]